MDRKNPQTFPTLSSLPTVPDRWRTIRETCILSTHRYIATISSAPTRIVKYCSNATPQILRWETAQFLPAADFEIHLNKTYIQSASLFPSVLDGPCTALLAESYHFCRYGVEHCFTALILITNLYAFSLYNLVYEFRFSHRTQFIILQIVHFGVRRTSPTSG